MAFDFSTLVTDRTQQDVAYAKQLAEKLVTGTATEEEKAEWNSFTLKGVYNHTDLNRVTTALEVLKVKLESYGYLVPGYEKVKITHPTFGGGSNLPDDYIELEYIQSTGTQYIDTGFKPNQDTKVVMDVQSQSGIDHVLFSARTSASSNVFEMIWSNSSNCYRFYYNNSNVNMDGISVTPATRRTIVVDKNIATIDGYSVSRTYSAFQCECNMVLFARNTVGTIGAYTTGKLYSCQVFDNGTLIRDYIPCVSPSGDVGLFDAVNQQFYSNSGTGAFIAGDRVGVALPSGYTRLTYIESTGTQYIDTNFKPSNNTRVVLSAYNASTSSGWTYGTWDSSSSNQFAFSCLNTYSFRYGSGGVQLTTLPVGDFEVDQNKNAYNLNGTTGTIATQTFSCSHTMYLFAINANGSVSSGKFTGRIKKCLIYDNNVLVRDYIPCINPDGEVGLYDLVTEVFYGNSGTGVFSLGSRIGATLPSGYTALTYIESTGTQYIDTGINASVGTKAVLSFQATTTPTTNWWILSAVTSGTVLFRAGVNASAFRTDAGFTYSQTSSLTASTTANGVCTVNMSIPLYLFAQNEGGAVEFGKFKLYSCLLYNNGVLVRDYIPCLNDSGVAGLYDLVSESFFGSSGTGSFIAGAIPRELPEGYTQVEYIQSDGTQYIDTSFKPNGNTRVVMDIEVTSGMTSFLFGARNSGTLSTANSFAMPQINGSSMRSDYGSVENAISVNPVQRLSIDKNKNVTTVNGTTVTATTQTFSGSYSLYLLSINTAGTKYDRQTHAKLYSCKIYDNGMLVRDFVPCKNASGVFGLCDTVNGLFYQNAGTGTFTVGADVTAPVVFSVDVVSTVAVSGNANEYDSYTWYEFDWPTPELMTRYLLNISAVRSVISVMKTTPEVPSNVFQFTVTEVNNIEKIVFDIYTQLIIMPTTFIPCGEALCGGDNL